MFMIIYVIPQYLSPSINFIYFLLNLIFTIYKSERISKKDFIVKSKSILVKTCVHKKVFFQCFSTKVLNHLLEK